MAEMVRVGTVLASALNGTAPDQGPGGAHTVQQGAGSKNDGSPCDDDRLARLEKSVQKLTTTKSGNGSDLTGGADGTNGNDGAVAPP
eukprot:3228935-Karenia_brevis.AAC.1